MDNFIVSARKYRPATFMSVVGQGHITSTLRNAISRNQLAHAYLFCGPRGVGKTTCARIFAKAINCLSPTGDEACGECESCRSFNEGRSFNIHELDAASNNSVDDIRSLTDQVRIPPQIGRYSVYIIDEVHMLSAQAFNAFLKTLEEPPAHAVFILATTEKHKIIPTILSRCQIFDFNRIRVEDGVEYLKYIASQENVSADDESLHLIAMKADGGMRDALSMFDKAVSFCGNDLTFKEVAQTLNVLDYDTYFTITSLIAGGDYPAALTALDEVLRKGFSPQTFAGGLNGHFRDLLMCKNPQTLPLLEVTGTLLDRYRKQATECDAGFLFDAIALLTALDGTLRTATNQRLNVELGLMKLCGLGQKKNNAVDPASVSGSDSGAAAVVPPLVPHAQKQKSEHPQEGLPGDSKISGSHASVGSTQQNINVPAVPAGGEPIPKRTGHTAQAEITDTQGSRADSADSGDTAAHVPATHGTDAGDDVPIADGTGSNITATHTPQEDENRNHSFASHSEIRQQPAAAGNPQSQNPGRTSIMGTSIDAIMNRPKNPHLTGGEEEAASSGESVIDPESASKIANGRVEFLARLHRERPRIAMAMENMSVDGNRIALTVPSETLFEEIMRNRTEILSLLADVAGVAGKLEMEVVVREDKRARKPIKAEDKLKYLTEKNPTLTLLRKELNLEVE